MSDDLFRDPAHAIPVAGQLRASRRRWRIVAAIAMIIAVLALIGRFAGPGLETDHIARIVIDGTIHTDRDRLEAIDKLGSDAHVKAVIVAINSPGGTTAGGEELYEALGRLRAKKPVVAVIGELGASAAYMAAIAADRIYARNLSIVGSIGVLFQSIDAGKLLNTIGVDLEKVASGPLKAEPDFTGPIKPEVRQSLEAMVGDSFNWFVDQVSSRRGLDHGATLALADGRMLTGRQALADRLIDAVGGEADAIDWLDSEKKLGHDLEVETAWPAPKPGFSGFGSFIGSTARSLLGLEAPVALDGLVSLWQVGNN
jgi:protease-4